MKWIALALILASIPFLASWLRTNPQRASWIWGLLGFLPFVLGPWHLGVAPFATPGWSGYVKGWEITFLDAVAVAILFGSSEKWSRPAVLWPFLAYIIAVSIAVSQAKFASLAWSYPIQLVRALLVYLAVARVARNERGERAILTGLVAGLAIQAGYAIWARLGGALQTGGTLGHQNLLGFVSHMVVMPAFAMLLAGRWRGIATIGIVAGAIAVILTVSRATIALSAVGLILTFILSTAVRFSSRKAMVGFVGLILMAATFPLAQSALQRRFDAQRTTFFAEDAERKAFERAAWLIINEQPMGIGPNHYVFIANTEGYSARSGVSWSSGSRATNVHNSFLLVAAETGWLGLTTLILLLGSAVFVAFATAFRFRRENGSDILIGVGCALVVVCMHSLFEWMFVVVTAQYLFAAMLGLIAGLRSRFLLARLARRQKKLNVMTNSSLREDSFQLEASAANGNRRT